MLQGILFCVLHYTTSYYTSSYNDSYHAANSMKRLVTISIIQTSIRDRICGYVGYCRNLHYNCSKLSISAVTWTFSGARVILQNAACIAADCVQISKPSSWLYVWELYICYIWYHYIYEYRKIYQLCNLIVLVGMSHLRVFACDTYNVC